MVQCLPWQGEDQHCSWTVTSEYKDEKKDIPCVSPHSRELLASHTEAPFLSLRRATFVSLVFLVVEIVLCANEAPGCAAMEHHSAVCSASSTWAGWISVSWGQALPQSTLCAQLYKQQWLAGHLEETCINVSCFFHCQSFSRPAFCFTSFLAAEACYSLPALLLWLQPLWAALCLPRCYSTLHFGLAFHRCTNEALQQSGLYPHSQQSPFSQSSPLQHLHPKCQHWLKSAATQTKPWFYFFHLPPRPAGSRKFCSL